MRVTSVLQWTNGDEVVADRALVLVEDLDQGAMDGEDDLDLGIGLNKLINLTFTLSEFEN